MLSLVGGRGDEDDPGERRRLSRRGLLVLLTASTAAGLAVGLPELLRDAPGSGSGSGSGAGSGSGELAAARRWESVRVCRTEPAAGCVERGPADAERLAQVLLPLRPVPADLITCLAVGERYAVLLRGEDPPPELTVDALCGPVLAGQERYEADDAARAAVAGAWAGR